MVWNQKSITRKLDNSHIRDDQVTKQPEGQRKREIKKKNLREMKMETQHTKTYEMQQNSDLREN